MINKRLILVSGILFCFFLLTVVFLRYRKNTTQPLPAIPTPTPIPVNLQQQQALQPGVSSEQDVKNIYGNPVKTEITQGTVINYYAIPDTWRQNKVYISKDRVQYIVQEQTTDNSLYKDFVTSSNKQPDGILSDPQQAGSIIKWYVFSSSGVAFLADTSGYTFRVIRFPSMTYQDFLNNVAPTFSMQQTIINTRDNNPQQQ